MSLRLYAEAAGIAVRNILWGGNAAAWRMFRHPVRLASYASETLFLQRTMEGRRGVPEKAVWEVLGGSDTQSIQLVNTYYPPWFGPIASYAVDMVSLCLICQLQRPTTIFEIGTAGGLTALHFALNTDEAARVFTLDLPTEAGVQPALRTTLIDGWHITGSAAAAGHVFDGRAAAERITCLYGDSATFDYSPWHDRVDFFFVDGAHSYEYVRSDTENAFRCVRKGGIVAWHDFGRAGVNGVTRLVHELVRDGREIFVVPGGSLAYSVAT